MTKPRHLLAVFFLLLSVLSSKSVIAQQGGTTQYVYDDNGRLHVVISPSGDVAIYDYDAAGNFTAIRRASNDVLELLSFSPQSGVPGDLVTFYGGGFGAGVSHISFNGTNARILSVAPSVIVAAVPQQAITGPITITTERGLLITPTPFTVRGLRISPTYTSLLFGEAVQFRTAFKVEGTDQSLKWSVNGIDGGNSSVGSISSAGLYTAPNNASTTKIRVSSVAVAELFAEAVVEVSNPENAAEIRTASISVSRGLNAGLLAAPVSVTRNIFAGFATRAAAVSVQVGGRLQFLTAVSATNGPVISSISPGTISRGNTVLVTLTGQNLQGTISVRFIDANGNFASNVSATNVVASADGTTVTATVSVLSGAAVGQLTAFVSSSTNRSQTTNIGSNMIKIQ